MPSSRSITEATEEIKRHIARRFESDLPHPPSARQILHRPFPKSGDDNIVATDLVIYSCRDGRRLRMGAILDAIDDSTLVQVDIERSLYTTYGDEAVKEAIGGVESAVALAVVYRGLDAWLTIINYHLYEHKDGEVQAARSLGSKILGPGLILSSRPAGELCRPSTASKYFPDSGAGKGFLWLALSEAGVVELEELTGVDKSKLE